jgi:hypothetical protein
MREWYPPPRGNNYGQPGKAGFEYIHRNYHDDEGLTVEGIPHNWVIGLVRPKGEEPRPSQYDFGNPQDKALLVNLSCTQDQ